ncbi:MAG: DegT/DnrJ/EryC1/StrS family aminotransferase [Candidatus Omnitrophica bacterium]|nr:DegT/DnrJ/EryC1/StrS family aminotransferase [Candidatus Omnitrophota bacterium]MDD5670074.1 DegT/DnrJ/EryC1/StrS family aminotransferase [Candidatus Omnitrophota bacterium]
MIPVFKPAYDHEEYEALKPVLESGWIGLGPRTEEFEKQFAKYIGVQYAVGLNSCTAALHLAYHVMSVEGREVITTPITFVSTNHAILYNDGVPVFCDVTPDTVNINADEIEKLISKKTGAITVVHYGGHACDMDKVLALAKQYNLKVIEDTAHGCGGEYKGKKLGSIGDVGCFSFHAVKNLAVGEGGMITTNDKDIYERLRKLRWLGISKGTWQREKAGKKYDWQYDVEEVGFKCHMHDISAAIGLVQLKKLDRLNARRREIADVYREGLKDLPWIETPVEHAYTRCSFHNYVIKLEKRDDLNLFLQERGISTGVHYYPNHLYGVYKPYYRKLPVAESIWKKLLTLPLYPDLMQPDIRKILDLIHEFGDKFYK